MARLTPCNVSRSSLGNVHAREIETLLFRQSRPLRHIESLPLRSLDARSPGRTVYGEVDFAVVNRAGRYEVRIEGDNVYVKRQIISRHPAGAD
jgi:hypothetical protein